MSWDSIMPGGVLTEQEMTDAIMAVDNAIEAEELPSLEDEHLAMQASCQRIMEGLLRLSIAHESDTSLRIVRKLRGKKLVKYAAITFDCRTFSVFVREGESWLEAIVRILDKFERLKAEETKDGT